MLLSEMWLEGKFQIEHGGYGYMLVLSRKIGEQILIGDDTVVVVSAISGGRVLLAIQAPAKTKILRGELNFWDDRYLPSANDSAGPRSTTQVA